VGDATTAQLRLSAKSGNSDRFVPLLLRI
jgi:hypothetical protein